jgi:hypothetical protein
MAAKLQTAERDGSTEAPRACCSVRTAGIGLTLALQAVASRAYYILFVPVVMFAAWFGGLAAGITASVATVVLTSPGPGRGSEFIVKLPNSIRSAA